MNVSDQSLAVSDFSTLSSNVVWLGARVDNNSNTISLRSMPAAGSSTTSNSVLGDGTMVAIGGAYFI
jgi:hypothetical protein